MTARPALRAELSTTPADLDGDTGREPSDS